LTQLNGKVLYTIL